VVAWSAAQFRRRHEIARGISELPPLTSSYTRTVLTQKLRRVIDDYIGSRLAVASVLIPELSGFEFGR
jgi:hypothetical protein